MKWGILDELLCRIRFNRVKNSVPKDSIMCDIGCGPEGSFLMKMANNIKIGIGFDADAQPATFNDGKITIHNLNILKQIPLDNESVDCITMLAVIEHLQNPQKIINECYRSLKPKGAVIITTPAPKSKLFLGFLAFDIGIISKKEIADHKNYFSKNELMQMIEKAGFNKSNIYIELFQFGLNTFVISKK